MRIRVVCYQLPGFKPQWLLTSMLDAERYPAAELIELYHQRWEFETRFDELHTHTLERLEALRSQTPDRIRQALFAMAVVYNLVRLEMARVAGHVEVSPLRSSYRTSLLLIRTLWLGAWLLVVCLSIWSNLRAISHFRSRPSHAAHPTRFVPIPSMDPPGR
jgi:hypothetical protein